LVNQGNILVKWDWVFNLWNFFWCIYYII
jgi:hypothetical protein